MTMKLGWSVGIGSVPGGPSPRERLRYQIQPWPAEAKTAMNFAIESYGFEMAPWGENERARNGRMMVDVVVPWAELDVPWADVHMVTIERHVVLPLIHN